MQTSVSFKVDMSKPAGSEPHIFAATIETERSEGQ